MPFSIAADVNKLIQDAHRFKHSTELSRIEGIFFDETGTPFCSACVSPVDNKPVALNLHFENNAHPSYDGGLFVYKCPKCQVGYHIAGNALAIAKTKRAKTP
jgi:hypothetical protein